MPVDGKKKGADQGIDGIIYFKPDGKKTERAVVSVKGGQNINVAMIRDLMGVMDRLAAEGSHFEIKRKKQPNGMFRAAINSLQAFINAVTAQRGIQIS